MFNFEHVNYDYDATPGLVDLTFTISQGEAVAIMGPNGSGKSTLFKILCGLLKPTNGHYTFDHQEPDLNVIRQSVGLVFQNSDIQLFNDTVAQELAFGPTQLGLATEEVDQRVSDTLALLNIAALRDRVPYQLSGGEKKLVALGSVLTMSPQTIILDEPFNGLSIGYQEQLTALFKTLHDHNKTLIISSHDYVKTAPLVDRVIALNDAHHLALDAKKAQLTATQTATLRQL
ncbi:energy-coupling factor ABC transporter ATP-binding protein [Furfurilactobacillus sp. WILCCON 0119]|uniref:energy-coupling factor ABC transporter ATP-binding protein n=1 Tax=Furfurilactobacillus entadae TaxID=2922307 RepID=UPI0035EC3E7D